MTLAEITFKLNHDQVKDIWHDLNRFRWPALWPEGLKPDWWVCSCYSRPKQDFIRPYMRAIEKLIPLHEILRWVPK